jgi:hypothetical protein
MASLEEDRWPFVFVQSLSFYVASSKKAQSSIKTIQNIIFQNGSMAYRAIFER